MDAIDCLPVGVNTVRPELSIGILLWPEFPLLALAGLIDSLRHAADFGDNSQKTRCSWFIMSPEPTKPVLSSSGTSIQPDGGFCRPEDFTYIAVIGGLLRSLEKGDPAFRDYIHRAANSSVPVIGICTGSFILAEEGLLDYRKAAVHPYHIQDFRKQHAAVYAETGHDFIDEGAVLTCAGGISTISLATELIRRHCGPDRATKAIHQMSVPNKIDDTAISVARAIGFTKVSDPRLRSAVFLIEQSLLKQISTAWLAAQVHLSARQLTRLFQDEFSKSPQEFIRSTRLKYSSWLLKNSTESITEIALRTGFSDCAHFIRNFQKEFGCTPGYWRSQ
ncbi:TPA: helix-turn-helix domain-containing protein [Klebsiella oxytoca]|nr:helix-turn-helix domain-containing protein [Klebsiella oxytoca]HCD8404024.1 helix-turn-helix domain-containing protein [Klebsiella oxytoca]